MNLSNALLAHEEISTTLAKAKSLRPIVEKLITISKKQNLHARRQIFSFLRDNSVVDKLLYNLSERYMNRSGGYIRIIKSGNRYGDMAPMAIVQLLDIKNIK